MPWFIQKQDDKFCVIKGTKDDPGGVEKCHPTSEEAVAHMRALFANVEDAGKAVISDNITGNLIHGSGGILNPMRGDKKECTCTKCSHETNGGKKECKERQCPKCGAKMKGKEKAISALHVYKNASGEWRWLSVSNVAVLDREEEIVSEKAYDDAIAYAEESNDFGQLDLVHVTDTDVGDCDMMHRLGNQLVEGGKWFNTSRAERVRDIVSAAPDYWGVSIKFMYDPEQFDGKVYQGGIRILKRSILPRRMAASWGTAIAVTGGNRMKAIDEETKTALIELGETDESVEVLNQKQKSLPDEVNVVEKEEETVWQKLRSTISDALNPTSEAAKSDVVEQPKAEEEVPTKTQDKADLAEVMKEMTKVLAEQVSESVSKIVAPINAEVIALKVLVQKQKERLTETEKFVEDKVIERLNELPPVVKARPTELVISQTELSPEVTEIAKSYAQKLFGDIQSEVKRKIDSGQYKI